MSFSLVELGRKNRALADQYRWTYSDWGGAGLKGQLVQIGCGDHVLPGFLNLDFVPSRPEVQVCNLLHVWPLRRAGSVRGFYSEDVLEHFFLREQAYILCSINVMLEHGGVCRVLMPDMDKLLHYGTSFDAERNRGDYLSGEMGCGDGMEAVNMGMRMGGHRWLHNAQSFSRLAALCGFEARPSDCADSIVPEFRNINLRTGFSLAGDLVKVRALEYRLLQPASVGNANLIEKVDIDQRLYRATTLDPYIAYAAEGLAPSAVALLNVRSANLSEHSRHSYSKIYFQPREDRSLYTDRTLHSAAYMNCFTQWDIARKLLPDETFTTLRFDPAEAADTYFTAGPMEVFAFSR